MFPSFFRSPKKPAPSEKRTVLTDISWQKFESLLLELGVQRQARLTYFRGRLELMTPVAAHERCSKLIESLILILVEELRLPIVNLQSVLLKNQSLSCATEPDACYYFGNVEPMQGKTELNFPADPVPDLVVEVALNRSNLNKLPIYATLGIPEVWRYITTPGEDVLKGKLLIYVLEGDRYIERKTSARFRFLPASRVLQFLEESDAMSLATAIRVLKAWIQETQSL